MQVKGLLVAVALLAVLGGVAWWSNTTQKDSGTGTSANPKLISLTEPELRKVELRRAPGETTVIERGSSGEWRITSPAAYPVDNEALAPFISAITKVEADKLVEENVADFTPYGLKSPGFYAMLTTKDGKLRTLLLGDETPNSSGWFARLAGDSKLYTIASLTKTSIDKPAAELRDKRLLRFDPAKLSRVELRSKGTAIELAKNSLGDWQLLKPQPMRADGWQAEELVRRLREARLDAAVTVEDASRNAASFASGDLVASASVTDASGTQTLEVRKTRDNLYLGRGSAAEGVYALPSDIGEGLNKSLDDFRNKKLFDFGFHEPSKVEYRDAERQRTFTKSGDRWLEGAKQMDSVGIQSLIDRLRELSATKFPAAGFTQGEIEITVVSNDGKRTEKLALAKAGAAWFGKREGEAPLYEVDAAKIEDLRKAAADVKESPPPRQSDRKK